MKKLVIFCLLVASSIVTFAQTSKSTENTSHFSVGVEVGLPLGSFAQKNYSIGKGFSLKHEFKIVNKLLFNLSGSYTSFPEKGSLAYFKESFETVSIKLGAKYYFNKSVFGEVQVGPILGAQGGEATILFSYAPGVGYSFDNGLEAGMRYEIWSNSYEIWSHNGTLSHLGLRVAYRF